MDLSILVILEIILNILVINFAMKYYSKVTP